MSGTGCLSHLARPLGTTAPRRRRIVPIPTAIRFQCRICARPLIGAPPSAPTAKRIPRSYLKLTQRHVAAPTSCATTLTKTRLVTRELE